MDPMVSGRVPLLLRNRVNQKLKELGSSPTELINKAYEFVDITNALPSAKTKPKSGSRKLDQESQEQLSSFFDKTTYPVPEKYFGNLSYDEILENEMRREYEALS